MNNNYRIEKDQLGTMNIPAAALYGIHSLRASENFIIAGRRVDNELIRAYGIVKLACIRVNRALHMWDDTAKEEAMEAAAHELATGVLSDSIIVDALQGGAGTSLNMNVNEVLANRALQILGRELGDYEYISPLADINLHQSTNDTFPSALKVAAIRAIGALEEELVLLQESFQEKEKEFAGVVKVGRTQYQDAVLTTLGREFSAYAECFNRDRWRVYKCVERLRVINLGGTAIGSGLAAPRQYIFRACDMLRELTGIGLARAENLIDATQNTDVFVEVSGILKACAANFIKVASDLRLLSSGPETGIGEIRLPEMQAGSSIMPLKVNPVIPEAVTQGAMVVMGNDQMITQAVSAGSLELNAFLPLIADKLLESIDILAKSAKSLRVSCISGIEAVTKRCSRNLESSTAMVTALLPKFSYNECARIAQISHDSGRSIREVVLSEGLLTFAEFEALITPEAVCRLGMPPDKRQQGI